MQGADYNLSYIIAAFILMLVVFGLHKKEPVFIRQNYSFLYLLVGTLLSIVFDFCSSLSLLYPDSCSRPLILLFNYVYYVLHTSLAFMFAVYMFYMSGIRTSSLSIASKIGFVLPQLIIITLIIANVHSGCLFRISETAGYTRAPLLKWIYLLIFFYIGLGVGALIKHHVIPYRAACTLAVSFSCIAVACIGIQYHFPQILLESYGYALSLLLLILSIHRSESTVDPIAGIANIKAFSKVIQTHFDESSKTAIMIICLDDLKLLASVFGIDKTNNVLRSVSLFMETIAAQRVYYLETGTFALLLPSRDVVHISHAVETRFKQSWMQGSSSIHIAYRQLQLCIPDNVHDFETLYAYVDYLRGLDNSQRWRLSASDINLCDTRRQTVVESCIKNAIETDSFQVFYQPIFAAKTGTVLSAEALIRMPDPNYGFISPAEFIPLAEKNGTILKIGEFLQESVCRFMREHCCELHIEFISLNLSLLQCMQEKMAERLLACIKINGLQPQNLCLEIAETVTVNSPQILRTNIVQLHNAGLRIALDDYGTGYSSINSLIDLPFDMIKFDKSMIDSGLDNDKGKLILGSSIALIKKMNLKIIAEGVETKEQMESLKKMKIDGFQGFYFSRALPETEFCKFCRDTQTRV